MKIKGYAASVIGSRQMNQDSFLISDETFTYAVADGVGGGVKGDVASKMAVEGIEARLKSGLPMRTAFEEIQAAILKEAMDTLGEALMGTTLTVVRIQNNEAQVCHVGDSRCYVFDGRVLRQLTEDQEFYDENLQGTVLASYLGIPTDLHPLKILEEKAPVRAGYQLLLCSDGLYRQLTEPRIVALIKGKISDPQALVQKLCEEASHHEYSDNVTVVLIHLEATP